MVKVQIIDSLEKEIEKKFKGEAIKVFKFLKTLEETPTKGKRLGIFEGMFVKELKYKGFRFYFIVDGQKLNFMSKEELIDLLMKFVRMSDKKAQQKTINEIREILIKIGPHGFE